MPTIQIRQFRTRFHLRPSQKGDRPRLHRVLKALFDTALEEALDRISVSPHEHICIRRLAVPLHLRLAGSESALAQLWSGQIAKAIQAALVGPTLEHGRGQNSLEVVRYSAGSSARFFIAVALATALLILVDRLLDGAWWQSYRIPFR